MTGKLKILFICRHNSGRSQIAEAYLRSFYEGHFEIQSAGLEPAEAINPLVVRVMREAGFDLSAKRPQSVFTLFKEGKLFDHVITVCQDTESKCPVFPGITKRWYWPFPDPAQAQGSEEEKLDQVRRIRDMIRDWLRNPPEDSLSFQQLINENRR